MITYPQLYTLLGGIGFILLLMAITGRKVGQRIDDPQTGVAGATGYFLLGAVIIVALIAVGFWWNEQYQPGGYFLP